MKKLFLLAAILSTQASYSSDRLNKCLGIMPSIYVPKAGPHVEILVYVEQNQRTKEVTITVTPFDQRRFDQANKLKQRLSENNTTLYVDQITAAITTFGKALPK